MNLVLHIRTQIKQLSLLVRVYQPLPTDILTNLQHPIRTIQSDRYPKQHANSFKLFRATAIDRFWLLFSRLNSRDRRVIQNRVCGRKPPLFFQRIHEPEHRSGLLGYVPDKLTHCVCSRVVWHVRQLNQLPESVSQSLRQISKLNH